MDKINEPVNYYLNKDLPGLRKGALIQWNETEKEYWVEKDNYADVLTFSKEEVEIDIEMFSQNKVNQ